MEGRRSKESKTEEKVGVLNMPKALDLIGQRFGRLVVIELAPKRLNSVKRFWKCQCDCGNMIEVITNNLTSGHTRSCGCISHDIKPNRNIDYFSENRIVRNERIYNIYNTMIQRCENPNSHNYKNYGERGISIDKKWRNDFYSFQDWSLKNGYEDNLTIDRINVNGNYEPLNCRWTTIDVQQNNKRNNILLTYNNETKTISEWSQITGIARHTIISRMKSNWSIEEILGIKEHIIKPKLSEHRKIPKDNKSSIPGVRWDKNTNKWHSYIGINNKLINLGYYENKEEAIKIREEAELKYFGHYMYK